jgi:hypothetical protein
VRTLGDRANTINTSDSSSLILVGLIPLQGLSTSSLCSCTTVLHTMTRDQPLQVICVSPTCMCLRQYDKRDTSWQHFGNMLMTYEAKMLRLCCLVLLLFLFCVSMTTEYSLLLHHLCRVLNITLPVRRVFFTALARYCAPLKPLFFL